MKTPSPLFSTLEKSNEAIELQVTQEYFGQAKHLVYLVPMWKSVLDFDLRMGAQPTPVKRVVKRPPGLVGAAPITDGRRTTRPLRVGLTSSSSSTAPSAPSG